ncbi:MAG: hypothetical protein VX107_11970 [Pseudomonadota bacterium]|nr:hypothetical protein [Pseudomonadota bacterium]
MQQGYKPSHHEDLGESPNAQLMQDPELLAYMVDRFAVLGTPEECVAQIQRIREAGIHQILFTGFVDDRPELIENLGRHVFPRCRNSNGKSLETFLDARIALYTQGLRGCAGNRALG